MLTGMKVANPKLPNGGRKLKKGKTLHHSNKPLSKMKFFFLKNLKSEELYLKYECV